MNLQTKIISLVRFSWLAAMLFATIITPRIARAESSETDPFAGLFDNLDKMLKEIEEKEKSDDGGKPEKKSFDMDEDFSFKSKQADEEPNKEQAISISKEPETRTDPYDLYINPAKQTLTKKDSKYTTPTPATRTALKTVHNELVDLLGKLETNIYASPRLKPEQRETLKKALSDIDQIIVSLNFISSKKAYTVLLLLPPEDNKKLVEELGTTRKTIVDLIPKLKKQIDSLQLTEKEELKAEEEKLSQLESFAKKEKTKETSTKTFSYSELKNLSKLLEELTPLAKKLGEFTKSEDANKQINLRRKKRDEQEKAAAKRYKEKSSSKWSSSSSGGSKSSRSSSKRGDDDDLFSELFGRGDSSSSSSGRSSSPSSDSFFHSKDSDWGEKQGKEDKLGDKKNLSNGDNTGKQDLKTTPEATKEEKDKKKKTFSSVKGTKEDPEVGRAYNKTIQLFKDAYTQINDAHKTKHKDQQDAPKYLLNRHIFTNLDNVFEKISSKKTMLTKENIEAHDKKSKKNFVEEEARLKKACEDFLPHIIHAYTLAPFEGAIERYASEQEKAGELLQKPLFAQYVPSDKVNLAFEKRDEDLGRAWKENVEESDETKEQTQNFKDIEKTVKDLAAKTPTRKISTVDIATTKGDLAKLKTFFEKQKTDLSTTIEKIQTSSTTGGLGPKLAKVNDKLEEISNLEKELILQEKNLTTVTPAPSTPPK